MAGVTRLEHMAEQSKTVDAALTLLAALRDNGGHEATTADLARRLGLSRTATARLLATLAAHDLATRTASGWALGQGLRGLAGHVSAAAEATGAPTAPAALPTDQVVVSAPIVDDQGTPIASLRMIAPRHLDLSPAADVTAAVQAAARTISAELSANGGAHAPLPTRR